VAVFLVALGAGAAAGAQGIPTPPTIPEPPGLGKPDDMAKFRLVVEGSQNASTTVTGSTDYPPCVYEFNVNNEETWEFARGKGVTMVFERFGKNLTLRRQGHPLGDNTLALVGTVVRTAEGGYNEFGPPPCRGSFPSNQTNCNTSFPVNSPLSLFMNPKGELSLDRTASQSLIDENSDENPAHLCGSDDQNPDTAWYLYSYPYFLNTGLEDLSRKQLFGKRHALVLRGHGYDYQESGSSYVNRVTTTTDVTIRLIRQGD
jgi:hypothetical protein